ncbi:FUSC family protein [Paraburkholderia domus]|uniref:FUSC family protein n=1 Tax=Paraburkholderia domus TaxID=2793075 RepID=UPI001B235D09|nr:FUSC family protein [Paraburkholderia domus]CAE6841222.1 p-hydroxybenzoic acid efflux pump subunit AaeB [Paraburkholderia domus]
MTASPAARPDRSQTLKEALSLYFRADGTRFLHVFKTVLAVVLATGVSMRLELSAPRTAMVSVVILMMHQHSGMVMARGFYRGLGMLVGNMAALLLIALFPQERVLFLLALALWIGLCVWGAAWYRNYQSYGFVLAGYATCIAALPSIDHPYDILDNVVTSLSEVTIGIVCASLVSALIFPQHVRGMLLRVGASHFSGFLAFIRTALTGRLSADELGSTHLRLIAERAQLENLRSAAVFEDPDLQIHNDVMTRLASEFLDASARFHSLHQFRHRLRATAGDEAANAIDTVYAKLADLLPASVDPLQPDLPRLERFQRELGQLADQLPELCRAQRGLLTHANVQSQQLAESGAAQMEAALDSLRLYLRDFIALRQPGAAPGPSHAEQPARIVTRANRMVSFAAGLRATCAIGAVSLFWIASGWTGASGAVISAAIASALYSIMPAPAQATRQMVAGCCSAWLASLFFNFYLLPHLDGFAQLAAVLIPFIMIGSYLNSFPKTATIGLGFSIYFCFLSNLTNPSVYAPTLTLDAGFSAMLGIGAASLAYSVVAPYAGDWVTGLYLHQLRRLVTTDACYGKLAGLQLRFDSGVRDFVQQISARPVTGRYSKAALFAWSFASIEIGRSIIELRGAGQDTSLPPGWAASESRVRAAVARMFATPSAPACDDAVQAVNDALSVLTAPKDRSTGEAPALYARLRAPLNFIRLSLLDNLVPLQSGDSQTTT